MENLQIDPSLLDHPLNNLTFYNLPEWRLSSKSKKFFQHGSNRIPTELPHVLFYFEAGVLDYATMPYVAFQILLNFSVFFLS